MIHDLAKTMLVGSLFWLVMSGFAEAQVMRPFEPGRRDPYATAGTRPTVSPYMNLSYNNDGISNYQTLVRPMMEEREDLNRQWTALEALNRRVRGVPDGVMSTEMSRAGTGGRGASNVRWMHYSHFYGSSR